MTMDEAYRDWLALFEALLLKHYHREDPVAFQNEHIGVWIDENPFPPVAVIGGDIVCR